MKVTILGAGNVAKRIAQLMSKAGEDVVLAVRDVNQAATEAAFPVMTFENGIEQADVVVIAIPFNAVEAVCAPFSALFEGKIVVDATNPLDDNWGPLLLGEQNSAGESVQAWLPQSKVVKAFNTIFADVMAEEQRAAFDLPVTGFIASDFTEAKQWVSGIMESAKLAVVDTGELKMSRYLEAMAHLNIQIAVGQQGGTQAAFAYQQIG